ncbi:hypothetical protein [Mucilaginibacter gracilis]|nr:hypothetical protein [Mucilaginibacter gracilis]
MIAETYYKVNAYQRKLWLSPDYQLSSIRLVIKARAGKYVGHQGEC